MPVLLHQSAVAFLTACLLTCSVCGNKISGGVTTVCSGAGIVHTWLLPQAMQQMLQHEVQVMVAT